MRWIAGLAAALALAGCGGGQTRAVLATEMYWPHGLTVATATFHVPGKVAGVTIGAVRLQADRWACLNGSSAVIYRVRGEAVTIAIDDDAGGRCAAEPNLHVPIVGVNYRGTPGDPGYVGYTGEWSPVAISYG